MLVGWFLLNLKCCIIILTLIICNLNPMRSKKKHYSELQLKKLANTVRQDVMKILVEAGSGHSAGPLGMADVLVSLYFRLMNIDPKKPNWSERDRFVISCGHYAPVLYTVLARAGFFPVKDLYTLRKLGTYLHGHPHNEVTPGIETSSGPLGHGLAQAVGMAYAGLMDDKKWRVYCMMSDGEQEEGCTWEAAMFAGKNKLRNLTGFIDRNNIQIDGYTEDVMPLEPLRDKYEAFNWHVLEVDGHNIEAIIDVFREAEAVYERPTVIICHTIPGKGVDFMERDFKWHGSPPKPDEAKEALHQLRTLRGKIVGEHE
jgi:transketolase